MSGAEITAHAAYLSATVRAATLCPDFYNNPDDRHLPYIRHLNHTLQHLTHRNIPALDEFPLRENGKPDLSAAALPTQVSQIPAFYGQPHKFGRYPLQRNITRHLRDQDRKNLLPNKRDQFILDSAAHGASWLNASPNTYCTTFPDPLWKAAIHHFLDLPLTAHTTACACGEDLTRPHSQDHIQSCTLTKRKALTKRHDQVNYTCLAWASSHGLPSIAETSPGCFADQDRKRPDGSILCPSNANLIIMDTTIAHPTTISNIRSAKHDASLRSAEAAKIKKYKHLAIQEESTFLPLAISSFGHFSDSALKLVQLLATEATLQTGENKSILAKDLKRHILCSLMKGNAIMRLHSALLCRMKSRPSHIFSLAADDEDLEIID